MQMIYNAVVILANTKTFVFDTRLSVFDTLL